MTELNFTCSTKLMFIIRWQGSNIGCNLAQPKCNLWYPSDLSFQNFQVTCTPVFPSFVSSMGQSCSQESSILGLFEFALIISHKSTGRITLDNWKVLHRCLSFSWMCHQCWTYKHTLLMLTKVSAFCLHLAKLQSNSFMLLAIILLHTNKLSADKRSSRIKCPHLYVLHVLNWDNQYLRWSINTLKRTSKALDSLHTWSCIFTLLLWF
jgi:hypothetical protein